jgi:outer membrane protein assembly factor BamA
MRKVPLLTSRLIGYKISPVRRSLLIFKEGCPDGSRTGWFRVDKCLKKLLLQKKLSKKNAISIKIVFLCCIFLSSCSVSKYIPQDESLYTGAKINTHADSSFTKKQTQVVNEQLETIIRPIPNSTVLGFPYKVWLYYVVGEPKKSKGLRQWFRKKFGEPPVLASKRAVATNTEIINNFLNNEGYFRSTASGELVINGKKAEAVYKVFVKPRYTIGKVEFIKKDSSALIKNIVQTQANSLLRVNEPYRFDNIKLERERIDKALKLNGYYYFRPDFLLIKADSNQNARKVDLFLELKPNLLQTSLKQYFVKDISVYVDTPDSTNAIEIRRGLRVFDKRNTYKPRVFNDAVGFRSGRLYSSQTHDVSLARLINLRNFKFVKNRFDLVNRSDSALINVVYELTPLKSKSFQAEFNALTRSNNLAGTLLGVNWSNRNIFRGAEILKLGVNTGFDFQIGSRLSNSVNSYYRVAGDADLTFPRFLLPFYNVRAGRNQALPKTNINVGYERLIQKGVGFRNDSSTYSYTQYTITSLRSSLGYSWRKNTQIEHSFTPLSINLIKPKNISEEFVDIIIRSASAGNIQDLLRYDKILQTRLILGGQYNFIYTPTQRLNSRHYFYLNAGVDIAGNISGLIRKKLEDGSKRIMNTIFEQYARFDLETRYYLDFTPNIRLANRLILGYGLPYGNSLSLPYQVKQYFVGGSNSIRAFRARSLGPGSFKATDSLAIFTSYYGDVKLEMNSELRIKVSQLINLAIFVDAGNIWSAKYNDQSFYSEDGTFGKNFYKQIAVGGGMGLRLDLTYIKIRFDFAVPFRKPWLDEKERWVIDEIAPFSKSWRKQNFITNIAVDYPF